MSKSNIGGLFVSLGLDVDKGSFDTGNKLIDNVGNSCNKLIGSARNATNALSTLTVEVSKIGGATYKTAQQFGMTTDALNLWRTTARMATNDTNSLDYALNRLSDVKVGMKTGKDFSAFTSQLSFLRMGYNELEGKETGEQLQTILEHAISLKATGKFDTQYIAKQIQDLLGKGAADVFKEIADSGKSVSAYLEEARKKASLVTGGDYDNLKEFQRERQELNATIDNIKTLLGAKLAENLKDPLSKLNEWLDAHGAEITQAMDKLGTAIANALVELGKGAVTVADVADAGSNIITALTSDNPEEKKEAEEKLTEKTNRWVDDYYSGKGGTLSKLVGTVADSTLNYEGIKKAEKLAQELYNEKNKGKFFNKEKLVVGEDIDYGDYVRIKKFLGELTTDKYFQTPELKDGIIRPDGTVTQVAPDDWVFAAKNVGDLARAFIPQNHNVVSAPSEYVINQTFNVSGGNDMPQVLKQQAYMGTQEGLLEIMRQSSERLQLMSGTR